APVERIAHPARRRRVAPRPSATAPEGRAAHERAAGLVQHRRDVGPARGRRGAHCGACRQHHGGGAPMTAAAAGTGDGLDTLGAAGELETAWRGRDGPLRTALLVWVVRAGDDLYVRAADGRTAAWFRRARAAGEGHVRAGGVVRDVTFLEGDGSLT